MNIEDRVAAFEKLGKHLNAIDAGEVQMLTERTRLENPWFTSDSVKMALEGVKKQLRGDNLRQWVAPYFLKSAAPKTVAIVMAGNIPCVGFHDLLSVLISGHSCMVKLSSKDTVLSKLLIEKIIQTEPRFANRITVVQQLKNFDAVIATGSDNSARYFEYYFGKYPHIIRKNRTSCAILTGLESSAELHALGTDVFSYFGLGCRNVSKIYAPDSFDFTTLLDSWSPYHNIIHHHKYHNNYDYQKSILLVNKMPFLDNGFVMLQENEKLVSPISVVFYETYATSKVMKEKLDAMREKIQCIVGQHVLAQVPFGQAQFPELWDYADQIDTLKFLSTLN